jgi:hypothetical protein
MIINAADNKIKTNERFLLGIFACGVEVGSLVGGAAVVLDGVPLA